MNTAMFAPSAASNRGVQPITAEGYRRLRELLTQLTTEGRAEVTERLRDARGDGGSAADSPELMHAFEEQLRLERRIAEIESRLAQAEVVDGGVSAGGRAALGTRIRLQRLDAEAPPIDYELVSSVEADPSVGMLSAESPLGSALLGRRAGETIEVNAPRGPIRFAVVAVEDAERYLMVG
jgi:transcription elongation factor GreA